jgi:predicted dehydrogenase
MVAACKQVKLMIAYRQQYEPMNRVLEKVVRDGKLGKVRSLIASNSQNEGDPHNGGSRRSSQVAGLCPM